MINSSTSNTSPIKKIADFFFHCKMSIINDTNQAFQNLIKILQEYSISQDAKVNPLVQKNHTNNCMHMKQENRNKKKQIEILQQNKQNHLKKEQNNKTKLGQNKNNHNFNTFQQNKSNLQYLTGTIKIQTPNKRFSKSEIIRQRQKSIFKITPKSNDKHKLIQLNKKKSLLMQKLKEIDNKLQFQLKFQNFEAKQQDNQNKKTQGMITITSRIQQKVKDKQIQKRSLQTFRINKKHPQLIFRSEILSLQNPQQQIQNQQKRFTLKSIQTNVEAQHKKAIQMLRKIHQQKMKRQEKKLQKIRKKQEDQIQKLKELKSLKQEQIARSRARGLFNNKSNSQKNAQKSVLTQKKLKNQSVKSVFIKQQQVDVTNPNPNKMNRNSFTQIGKKITQKNRIILEEKPKKLQQPEVISNCSQNSFKILDKGKKIFNNSKIDEVQDQNLYQNQNYQQNFNDVLPLTLDQREKPKQNDQLHEFQNILESYDNLNSQIESKQKNNSIQKLEQLVKVE